MSDKKKSDEINISSYIPLLTNLSLLEFLSGHSNMMWTNDKKDFLVFFKVNDDAAPKHIHGQKNEMLEIMSFSRSILLKTEEVSVHQHKEKSSSFKKLTMRPDNNSNYTYCYNQAGHMFV